MQHLEIILLVDLWVISSTNWSLVVSLGHPQPTVSPFNPSVLPFGEFISLESDWVILPYLGSFSTSPSWSSEAPENSKYPKTPTRTTNTPTSSPKSLLFGDYWLITHHNHQTLHDKGTLTPQGKESTEPHPICQMLAILVATEIVVLRSTTTYLGKQ